MRFLNPKTDLAFKKIFGSETSHGIVISFLNAILELPDEDRIVDVTILDPYQAPKIEGMKDSFLDVKVRDQRGRSYIVEMQVLNVEGFEKRVLYNACKAYVGQLGKGDAYRLLTEVVAVTISDFIMYPELSGVVSRFRLCADENPLIFHKDLTLVFAELPKFTKAESELATPLDRWLYFFKTASDLSAIPQSLAVEPAIVQALEKANCAAWTEEELDAQEKKEFWIADAIYIRQTAAREVAEAEKAAAQAVAKAVAEAEKAAAQAVAKAVAEAEKAAAEGEARGRVATLLRQLRYRFGEVPEAVAARIRAATPEQLDAWIDTVLDAPSLEAVLTPP